jgi:hypothetical protein
LWANVYAINLEITEISKRLRDNTRELRATV